MATVTGEMWRSAAYHSCGAAVIPRPYEELSLDTEEWPLRFWCNYCSKYVHRRECRQAVDLHWSVRPWRP